MFVQLTYVVLYRIMKFQFRFFIALCVFLFSGYGQLYAAHTHKESISITKTSNVERSQDTGLDIRMNDITNYALCYIEKGNNKSYTINNENEENETSSRKWLELNNYFVAVLSANTPEYLYPNIKKCLPSCKHFSFLQSSCKKYIMFRVFRI